MTSASTNTLGGSRPRNEHDQYFTPDALAIEIAARVREEFGDFGLVVEPSAGNGAFIRAARATWPGVPILAVEPNVDEHEAIRAGTPSVAWFDRRWEDPTIDGFCEWRAETYRRLVIGNPPYDLAEDKDLRKRDKSAPTTAERHIHLALERMRDGDVLAFLLRLSFLSGGARIDRLHEPHPLAALWPVTPRPSFTDGATDNSEYGVFVWAKGLRGPGRLGPVLRWTPKRKRGAS